MTEEQSEKIQVLKEKYQIKESSYIYFFAILGVGYNQSVQEIEDFLFKNNKENMIKKDVRRICSYYGLPMPDEAATNPEKELKEIVQQLLDAKNSWDETSRILKKLDIPLSNLESRLQESTENKEPLPPSDENVNRGNEEPMEVIETVEEADMESNEMMPYSHIGKLILEETRFHALQLEVIQEAMRQGMPESILLKMADPEKTTMQMEQYLAYWNMTKKKEPEKKGIFSFHRRRSEV